MSYMVICEIPVDLPDGTVELNCTPYSGEKRETLEDAGEELEEALDHPAVMGRAWIVEVGE